MNEKFNAAQLDALCAELLGEAQILVKHHALIGIRMILSADKCDPPIQRVIDNGLIPILIHWMNQQNYPQMKLEACWILTNVASGTNSQCESIIARGGLQIFIRLLYERQAGIVDQALWAIGNIAGDCAKFRDDIISKGGIECLLKVIEQSTNKNVIRYGAWALSNLCRGCPLPKYQVIRSAIPVLCRMVATDFLDNDTMGDCLWAISHFSEGQKSRIQRVLQTGVIPHLLQLCNSPCNGIAVPAVRIIGNISTGNELQTEQIIKHGGLEVLLRLMGHTKKSIRRESCWIVSNILAGTKSQVDRIIHEQPLIDRCVVLFHTDDNDVKKQLCYVFGNMSSIGEASRVGEIYASCQVLQILSELIKQDIDVRLLQVALIGLKDVLRLDERIGDGAMATAVQRMPGLLERLQSLQYHKSKTIYQLVHKIFQSYFKIEEEV